MDKPLDILKNLFLSIFDIRQGELRRALLMQFNIFLIITTLLIVKPTINGLFLARFGVEQLPFAFILVAAVAALVTIVYSRLLTRISLFKINISTLALSVVSLLLFGIFLRLKLFEGAVLYLFYIWVAIFALLTTSQFWVLANMVFNAREAKRLFGFVGAGAIGGGIVGGYLTSILAEGFGSINLPFVCAGILSLSIPITWEVWKKNVTEVIPQFERRRTIKRDSKRPWHLIRQSKHLRYVAFIVGISVMVAKLVDFQFSNVASNLIPDADELTAFFGFWFSTFNVISLLVQLFLTRRLVGTLGVGTSLFFLPGMILIAAVVLLIAPELLMAAIFIKMADGGLKQSLNKAAMELIIMPISKEVKTQTKTFIDVFVDSLATGFIGLLLVFVIKGLDLPMTVVNWMILGLIILWIYFAYKVRKEYLRTFQLILKEVSIKKENKKINISSVSILNGWRTILEKGEPAQMLFVLRKLKDKPDERLFLSIKNLLHHSSDEVVAAALECLYFLHQENLSNEVRKFIHHPMQKVKIAAFEYLLLRDPTDEIALMKQYIADKDYRVSGAALVSLAKETRQNPDLRRQLDLQLMIGNKIKAANTIDDVDQKLSVKISVLKAIGHSNLANYYHYITQSLNDKNEQIVKEAIIAAGNTLSTLFIPELLEFLKDQKTTTIAVKSLANYKEGLIPIFKIMENSGDIDLDILRKMPLVVRNLGRQNTVDYLFELLEHDDGTIRLEALRALNHLRTNYPHLDFKAKKVAHWLLDEIKLYQNTLTVLHAQTMIDSQSKTPVKEEVVTSRRNLIALLDKKLERNMERIFRLLGLKYPPDDIYNIYRGLIAQNSELTLNAIEFLDNLLDPGIKKVLIPLIESSMIETISERAAQNLRLKIPNEFECFKMILQGKDDTLKMATISLIKDLGQEKYTPLMELISQQSNE